MLLCAFSFQPPEPESVPACLHLFPARFLFTCGFSATSLQTCCLCLWAELFLSAQLSAFGSFSLLPRTHLPDTSLSSYSHFFLTTASTNPSTFSLQPLRSPGPSLFLQYAWKRRRRLVRRGINWLEKLWYNSRQSKQQIQTLWWRRVYSGGWCVWRTNMRQNLIPTKDSVSENVLYLFS